MPLLVLISPCVVPVRHILLRLSARVVAGFLLAIPHSMARCFDFVSIPSSLVADCYFWEYGV